MIPPQGFSGVTVHNVEFEKGPGVRKGLGFSVVGGIDSPRGEIIPQTFETFNVYIFRFNGNLREDYFPRGSGCGKARPP